MNIRFNIDNIISSSRIGSSRIESNIIGSNITSNINENIRGDMNDVYISIIAALVLLVVGVILIKIITTIKKRRKYPYESKMLLTRTEYAFFKQLQKFTDEKEYMICPKVRLEDFIYVTNRKELSKYRGYIKSRHVDFLICDNDLHIICGIELDDKSHDEKEAKRIDRFKNELFETIGIRLYRINVEDNYEERLRKIII